MFNAATTPEFDFDPIDGPGEIDLSMLFSRCVRLKLPMSRFAVFLLCFEFDTCVGIDGPLPPKEDVLPVVC